LESLKRDVERLREYIDKLEELRRKGAISDLTYEALRREYEEKLAVLVGKRGAQETQTIR